MLQHERLHIVPNYGVPEFATAQTEPGAKRPRSDCLHGKGHVQWSRNGT